MTEERKKLLVLTLSILLLSQIWFPVICSELIGEKEMSLSMSCCGTWANHGIERKFTGTAHSRNGAGNQ